MRRSFFVRLLPPLVAAAFIVFGISSAGAQPSSITIADLARQSDVVAVGHVSSLLAQWDESHTRIRTQVTIAVAENVKGASTGATITVLVPGGEVDGIGEVY